MISRWRPILLVAATLVGLSPLPGSSGGVAAQVSGPSAAQDPSVSLSRPFLLDAAGFAALAEPGGAPMWTVVWPDRPTRALQTLVEEALGPDTLDLYSIVDGRFADSVGLVAAVDTLLGLGSGEVSAARPVVVDDALDAVPPDTAASVLGNRLKSLIRPVPATDRGPAIGQAVLDAVQGLVGVWFPDGYMMRTALRTSLAATDPPATEWALGRILAVSQRPPGFRPDSLNLQPLAWDGGGCGCGTFTRGVRWEPEVYGIYPFWEAPQGMPGLAPPDTIDLSMLTRVGYYGVTFGADGTVSDPLHWRTGHDPPGSFFFQGRDFSEFSVVAQKHKVRVDLVVYQGNWDWLPESLEGVESEDQVEQVFSTLSSHLVDSIITPDLPNFTNGVRPWASLGLNHPRTLGDGLTLDFDFEGMELERQAELFELMQEVDFFGALKGRLDAAAEARNQAFGEDQAYSLNVVVPLECVRSNREPVGLDPWREGGESQEARGDGAPLSGGSCGFYSIENMARMQTDSSVVDLFLVDMTAVEPGSPLAGMDLPGRARRLRASLDRLEPTKLHSLAPTVLPLAVVGTPEVMGDFVQVADVSFSGLGGWSVTSMGVLNPFIQESFLEPSPTGWVSSRLDSFESEVCRIMCPVRWTVRFLLFLVALAYLAFWLVTESRFDLKRFYGTSAHSSLVVVYALAAVGTLWCDPYWAERQAFIVGLVAVVGLGIFLVKQNRLRQERDYP